MSLTAKVNAQSPKQAIFLVAREYGFNNKDYKVTKVKFHRMTKKWEVTFERRQ